MRYINLAGVLFFFGICISFNAQTLAAPTSQPEDAARERLDAATRAAQQAFDTAMIDAQTKYVADLDAASKLADAGHDEASIARIAILRNTAAADLARLQASHPAGSQTALTSNKSVVFVCAGGGSMIGGGKDELLRTSLKQAVSKLTAVQSFNVLQFQHVDAKKKFVALGGDLLVANPNNKKKLFDFIDNQMVFHGETNPIPALEEAFREHPQVILLLTDGDFEDNDSDQTADAPAVIAKIAELNKDKRVHVNTIMLMKSKTELDDPAVKQAVETMKKIATDNGGNYIAIAADEQ